MAAACAQDGNGGGTDPDLDFATTAARLEKVFGDTYTSLRSMAVQARLGAAVPQAVVEFLTAATGHHQEHLNAWNRVLAAGGRSAVESPDPELRQVVDGAVVRVTDIPALVRLALRMEDYASRTYLQAVPGLGSEEATRTAAQVLVVDQQHQAVLRYFLGLPPNGSGVAPDTTDFAPSRPRPELLTR